MQSYLDEQMWRQRIAGTLQQAMQNFLAVLASFFKVSISFTLNFGKDNNGK